VADSQRLRVGLVSGARKPFPELVRRWQEAEQLGFDTVWVTDHFITGDKPGEDLEPIYDAWALIGALAMTTSTIRFGVMVTGNTYRNPALLAKEAVTVDHISNGRLDFGIGAGWWEREHQAYGWEFPDPRELVDRFEEALEIISRLQTQERTDFHGKYYWVDDAPFEPKPIQQPHMPLVIGSSGPRMMKLTARFADIWNTRSPIDEATKKSHLLDEKCREVGRDPGEIMRSVWPGEHPWSSLENVQDVIRTYRDAGFTDFVFTWPPDENVEVMRQFARDVLPGLRG
jgi:F420-dependent oxidoreductase-like protein